MKGSTVNEKSAQSSIAPRVGSAIAEQGKRCNGGEIDGWYGLQDRRIKVTGETEGKGVGFCLHKKGESEGRS